VSVAYSSSYGADPIAAHFGVNAAPAIVVATPAGNTAMTIPRNRKDFTEDLLTEWVTKTL